MLDDLRFWEKARRLGRENQQGRPWRLRAAENAPMAKQDAIKGCKPFTFHLEQEIFFSPFPAGFPGREQNPPERDY